MNFKSNLPNSSNLSTLEQEQRMSVSTCNVLHRPVRQSSQQVWLHLQNITLEGVYNIYVIAMQSNYTWNNKVHLLKNVRCKIIFKTYMHSIQALYIEVMTPKFYLCVNAHFIR